MSIRRFVLSLLASQPPNGIEVPKSKKNLVVARTPLLVASSVPTLDHITIPTPEERRAALAQLNGGAHVVTQGGRKQVSQQDGIWGNHGYSLQDYGITYEDIKLERARRAQAAKSSSTMDQEPDPSLTKKLAQKVVQNTQSGTAPAPTLQTNADRVSQANLALSYFLKDGVAGPGIRSLYEYVIGPGFDVDPDYNFEDPPEWFDINAPWVEGIKARFKGRASKGRTLQIFLEYLKDAAEDLKDVLDLETFSVDHARDGLVTGDGFAFRQDNIVDPAWETAVNQEFIWNRPWSVDSINPVAIELITDEFNTVTGANVKAANQFGGSGTPLSADDLTRLIHLKWHGSSYTVYGTSHLVNILDELALKASLMRAMKASADRFSTPIGLARFGMNVPGEGPAALPEWGRDFASALENYDTASQWLVAPFHWDLKYVGAEGGILNIAEDIAESNRRIMMGVGIPPNFLDSNYTSYSTAKIQVANMFLKLRTLQLAIAKSLETGIFTPWAEMRGFRDPNGQPIKFRVSWKKVNLEGDPDMLKLVLGLAINPAQTVASDRTLQSLIGLDPAIESQYLALEEGDNQTGTGQDGNQQDNSQSSPAKNSQDTNTGAGMDPRYHNLSMAVQEITAKAGEMEDRFTQAIEDNYEEIQKLTRARLKQQRAQSQD